MGARYDKFEVPSRPASAAPKDEAPIHDFHHLPSGLRWTFILMGSVAMILVGLSFALLLGGRGPE